MVMGEFFIWSTFFGMLLFLFPIFVGLDVYLDLRENKASFAISTFGLRVFGGYAEVRREGIAIHLTEKFALLLTYDKMGDTRKYFEVTAGFQLYKLHQIVETGGSDKIYGVLIAALLQSGGGAAFAVLRTRHPFLSLKNGTVLADAPCLKLTFETITVFNGLVLTLAITKKIMEALLNWIRNKRLTASWKKQRSSS